MKEDSLRALIEYLDGVLRPGFWGNITLACVDGEVSTVKVETSAKMKEIKEMMDAMDREEEEVEEPPEETPDEPIDEGG